VATHLGNGSTLGSCPVAIARGGETTAPVVRAAVIKAYPNPTTGVFELQLQNYAMGKTEIQVIDNYGKLVMQRSVMVGAATENFSFDVTKHAAGVYHVKVVNSQGMQTVRVIVAR
jgi:hypothetical protein